MIYVYLKYLCRKALLFEAVEGTVGSPANGIWSGPTTGEKFYFQKYVTGSSVAVVAAGGTLTAFLDPDYSDGVSSGDILNGGYSFTLNAADSQSGTVASLLPSGTLDASFGLLFRTIE